MATLPSFVELMESLGLSSDNESAGRKSHSRGSSFSSSASSSSTPPPLTVPSGSRLYRYHSSQKNNSSPSIVVSKCDDMLELRNDSIGRRSSLGCLRAARFTPYSPPPRRRSLSNVSSMSGTILEDNLESPNVSPPNRDDTSNPSSKAASDPDAQSNISDSTTCASISTFSRRHSPHTSPTSASFPHRHREITTITPTPVTLPTLPPLLAQSISSHPISFSTQSPDDDLMSVLETKLTKHNTSRYHHHHFHAGVRISSPYRLQAQQRHQRVAPVA